MIMKNYEMIYKYFHGELDEGELWEFKKSIESNPIMVAEVEQFKKIHDLSNDATKLDVLNSLHLIHQTHQESANRWHIASYYKIAVAATVLVLIGFGGFWLFNKSHQNANDKLFAAYFAPENSMFTLRSGTTNLEQPVMQGIQYYELKNYNAAVDMFIKAPENLIAKLYGALSYMELNEFEKAKQNFKQIIEHNDNLFIDQSEWNLGLCYIKTNDLKEARLIFEKIAKENSVYKTRAQKLLREMEN